VSVNEFEKREIPHSTLEKQEEQLPPGTGCGVQIGRSIPANPSPNGRGWPAPAGRV